MSYEVHLDGARIDVLDPVDSSGDVVKMRIRRHDPEPMVTIGKLHLRDASFALRIGDETFKACSVQCMSWPRWDPYAIHITIAKHAEWMQ